MSIDKDKLSKQFLRYMEKYHELKTIEQKNKHDEEDLYSSGPMNIYVEPTNRCNLLCEFCARENMERELGELSLEAFENIIKDLPQFSWISFLGNGEPLINNNVYTMIKSADERGFNTRIITNGTLLIKGNREKLLESGIDEVHFSFDSIEKNLYEKIRKGAKYRETLLKILLFIQEAKLSQKNNIFITVSSVQTEEVKKINTFNRKFWLNLPIDNFYESPLYSLQQQSKSYEQIERTENKFTSCVIPWVSVKINFDGSVNICPQDFSSKYPVGNVINSNLKQIQNNESAKRLRKAILEKDISFFRECNYNCDLCNTWESGYSFSDFLTSTYSIISGLNYEKTRPQIVEKEKLEKLDLYIEILKSRALTLEDIERIS